MWNIKIQIKTIILNFCDVGIETDNHTNSFSGKRTMLDHGLVALCNHGHWCSDSVKQAKI